MDDRRSPWSAEPDAPGVLILGTPPRSLNHGASAGSPQNLRLALEETERDFTHTFRTAFERQRVAALRVADLGGARRDLWDVVVARWRAALGRDEAAFSAALHPAYAGRIASEAEAHDRDHATTIAMASGLLNYELVPRDVALRTGDLGMVHYGYVATMSWAGERTQVGGYFRETFTRDDDAWLLVAASGSSQKI